MTLAPPPGVEAKRANFCRICDRDWSQADSPLVFDARASLRAARQDGPNWKTIQPLLAIPANSTIRNRHRATGVKWERCHHALLARQIRRQHNAVERRGASSAPEAASGQLGKNEDAKAPSFPTLRRNQGDSTKTARTDRKNEPNCGVCQRGRPKGAYDRFNLIARLSRRKASGVLSIVISDPVG